MYIISVSRKKLQITTDISKGLPFAGRRGGSPSVPEEPNSTISVGNNNALQWAIRQFSTNNQSLLWNTGSDLVSAGNNSSLRWNSRQFSRNNSRLLWNTEQTPVEGRAVISSSDITFLGVYTINPLIGYNFYSTNGRQGGELQHGAAFTHRYVDGQIRFLTYGYISFTFRIVEFGIDGAFGDVTSATNVWENIETNGFHHGMWWDEEYQRLWTHRAIDYPDESSEGETLVISIRNLNSDGTTSNLRGRFGLSGINSRRIFGGALKIPEWFRTQNSCGKYGVGFGGYASRLSVGPISMGPTLYAINDPTSYSDDTNIPVGQFKVLADHSSGSVGIDWYSNPSPTTFDRGVRPSNVTNDFESGEWLSPAPDGLGRWVWGDSAENTGCWVDNDAGTRNRHGYLIVPSFSSGRAWYEGSTLNRESKSFEIQVFDPAHLAEVIAGTRQPWNVKPVTRKDITSDLALHTAGGANHINPGGVIGASFDELTGRLYIYCNGAISPAFWSHLYVYQIA